MKLHIWDYVSDPVTTYYHSKGGVVICCQGDPQQAWIEYCGDLETESGKRLSDTILGEARKVIDMLPDADPFVEVFPDAGCC